jgi:CBS domain-containing protein
MELLNEEIGIEQKPVKEMVEPATAVPKDVSVQAALDACAADGVDSSAVTQDEGKLFGTVSKETMIRKVGGMGHDPESSPVEPQVNSESAYCFEDQTVSEAEQLMREKKIAEVPVVNEEKVLVGKTKLEKIEACKAEEP